MINVLLIYYGPFLRELFTYIVVWRGVVPESKTREGPYNIFSTSYDTFQLKNKIKTKFFVPDSGIEISQQTVNHPFLSVIDLFLPHGLFSHKLRKHSNSKFRFQTLLCLGKRFRILHTKQV